MARCDCERKSELGCTKWLASTSISISMSPSSSLVKCSFGLPPKRLEPGLIDIGAFRPSKQSRFCHLHARSKPLSRSRLYRGGGSGGGTRSTLAPGMAMPTLTCSNAGEVCELERRGRERRLLYDSALVHGTGANLPRGYSMSPWICTEILFNKPVPMQHWRTIGIEVVRHVVARTDGVHKPPHGDM